MWQTLFGEDLNISYKIFWDNCTRSLSFSWEFMDRQQYDVLPDHDTPPMLPPKRSQMMLNHDKNLLISSNTDYSFPIVHHTFPPPQQNLTSLNRNMSSSFHGLHSLNTSRNVPSLPPRTSIRKKSIACTPSIVAQQLNFQLKKTPSAVSDLDTIANKMKSSKADSSLAMKHLIEGDVSSRTSNDQTTSTTLKSNMTCGHIDELLRNTHSKCYNFTADENNLAKYDSCLIDGRCSKGNVSRLPSNCMSYTDKLLCDSLPCDVSSPFIGPLTSNNLATDNDKMIDDAFLHSRGPLSKFSSDIDIDNHSDILQLKRGFLCKPLVPLSVSCQQQPTDICMDEDIEHYQTLWTSWSKRPSIDETTTLTPDYVPHVSLSESKSPLSDATSGIYASIAKSNKIASCHLKDISLDICHTKTVHSSAVHVSSHHSDASIPTCKPIVPPRRAFKPKNMDVPHSVPKLTAARQISLEGVSPSTILTADLPRSPIDDPFKDTNFNKECLLFCSDSPMSPVDNMAVDSLTTDFSNCDFVDNWSEMKSNDAVVSENVWTVSDTFICNSSIPSEFSTPSPRGAQSLVATKPTSTYLPLALPPPTLPLDDCSAQLVGQEDVSSVNNESRQI